MTASKNAPEFEKYELGPTLAAGGMATVYRARRRADGMPCLVKVVHEAHAQNPFVARRFVREAQVVAWLDHPNIAQLLDARTEGGHFYTALEWVRGCDLDAVIADLRERGERLPVPVALRVALEVLEGLDYAHRFVGPDGRHLALAHRDISPKNVVLGRDGAVKIVDFGVVRAKLDDFRTATGVLVGTPAYMAPEQVAGEHADARADIYACGVVLFELLTGRLLVDQGQLKDALLEVLTTEAPPPTSIAPDVPPALDAVVARALAKRPADRFVDARAFVDAIRAAAPEDCNEPRDTIATLVERIAPPEPDDAWAYDDAGPTPVATRAAPAPEGPLRPSREKHARPHQRRTTAKQSPAKLVIAVLGLVGAGAAVAVVWWMRPAPTPAADPSSPAPALAVTPTIQPRPAADPVPPPVAAPAPSRPAPARTAPSPASPSSPAPVVETRLRDAAPLPARRSPRATTVAELRRELRAYRAGRRSPAQLIETAARIEREIERLPESLRRKLQGRAEASGDQNDVDDLFLVLDTIARTHE